MADPVQIANLVTQTKDLREQAKELLREVGTNAPTYYDAGVNRILVVLEGWNEARDPIAYIRVITK